MYVCVNIKHRHIGNSWFDLNYLRCSIQTEKYPQGTIFYYNLKILFYPQI